MESEPFLLAIKYKVGEKIELEVSNEMTVFDVKALIFECLEIPVERQKLIHKGKVLTDEKFVGELELQKTPVVQVMTIKPPVGDKVYPALNVPTNVSSGSHGLLNQMGIAPSTGNEGNPFTRQLVEQSIKMMLDNPSMMENMIQNNPQLREMSERNPEINGAMSNPAFREMLNDPTMINSIVGMMSRMNNSTASTMEGNEQSFPRPGTIPSQSNNQTDITQPIPQMPFGNPLFNTLQQPQNSGTNPQPQMPSFFNMLSMLQQNQNPIQNQNQIGAQSQPTPLFNHPNIQNTNFEEMYRDKLIQMEEMGFTNKADCLEALKAAGGNVEAAVERLFNKK